MIKRTISSTHRPCISNLVKPVSQDFKQRINSPFNLADLINSLYGRANINTKNIAQYSTLLVGFTTTYDWWRLHQHHYSPLILSLLDLIPLVGNDQILNQLWYQSLEMTKAWIISNTNWWIWENIKPLFHQKISIHKENIVVE